MDGRKIVGDLTVALEALKEMSVKGPGNARLMMLADLKIRSAMEGVQQLKQKESEEQEEEHDQD